METFGQKLRQAVESRGMTLDDVSRKTGISLRHLEALVRDDHGALPGDDSMVQALRDFARLVEVDPDLVVGDYLREREIYEQAGPPRAVSVQQETQIPDADAREVGRSQRRPVRLLSLFAVVALLALAAGLWLREASDPADLDERPAGSPAAAAITAPKPPPAGGDRFPAAGREASEITPAPAAEPDRDAASMETGIPEPDPADEEPGTIISHHGVGTGIQNHELIGEAERFAVGTRVWYWTLVEGAAPGEEISHVWIHEGDEALVVPLRIGGARWRTHSYKGMSAGSVGRWVVEARDGDGQVLARRAFQCVGSSER